jgi:PKD repeat protein
MSPYDGNYWGNFTDLNQDLIFIFSEIVYPAVSRDKDTEYLFLSFQEDGFPGLTGPEPPYSQNNVWFFPESLVWNPVTVYADFTCDTTIIPAGGSIQFYNLSYGNPPGQITYEWEFEGGIPSFSTDADPVVLYPEQGVYDVKLTASILPMASNVKLEEDFIEVMDPIGIHEGDHASLMVFPNPSSGEFRIGFTGTGGCTVRVFDQRGKIIMESDHRDAKANVAINLNSHPKGMYIIELITNERVIRQKIILE